MLPRLRLRTGQKAEDESALRTREQHGTEKQTLKVAAMKFRCSKTNRCSNILHFVLNYVFFILLQIFTRYSRSLSFLWLSVL